MRIRQFQKQPFEGKNVKKLIIDTHGGLQDIFAMIVAHKLTKLPHSDHQIIGITCVAGKNSLQKAVQSALAVNMVLGTKIPIFRGQVQTLLLSKEFPKSYLEQNFSEMEEKLYAEVQKSPDLLACIQDEKASDFIARVSSEFKNDLGVIALGPHTNLGFSHRIEECFNHIGLISLNGGQFMGVGSTINGIVEANYAHDPLASSILFEVRKKDLREILFTNPLENTLTFNWKQVFNQFLGEQNKLHPLLNEMIQSMLSINSIILQNGPLLTILPVLSNKVISFNYRVYGEVVRDGYNLDGLLAVNWLKEPTKEGQEPKYPNNLYIYGQLNAEAVTALVKEALLAP